MLPYSCEDDPSIRWRLWVLDVPRDKLCEVQDLALMAALELYEDETLPVLVSVATPAKTKELFPQFTAIAQRSGFVTASRNLAIAATVALASMPHLVADGGSTSNQAKTATVGGVIDLTAFVASAS